MTLRPHDRAPAGMPVVRRALSLAAALAAVAALAAIAHQLTRRAPLDPASVVATATAALGFLLMGGWLAGRLASQCGLPALTGQLLAGVCAGPSVADALGPVAASWGIGTVPTLVSSQDIRYLAGLDALAVAMIGIAAGGELELGTLRTSARRIWVIIGIEMPVVGIATGAALAALAASGHVALGADAPLTLACAITGSLMIASSPAVAIALAREHGNAGPFAQLSMVVIVAKDILLTLAFTAVVLIGTRLMASGAGAPADPPPGSDGSVAASLAWHLIGSLALGTLLGLPLTYVLGRIERRMQMVALVVAAAIAALSRSLELSPLLVSLAAGIALRAIAPSRVARFREAAGSILLPVCCVFFCLTGAKLDVQALAAILPATTMLCTVRLAAKWVGGTAGARVAGLDPKQARWIWACLVPQAGVAIALAAEVTAAFPGADWAVALSTLLISCVAMNEIVGPPLMRIALRRAQ